MSNLPNFPTIRPSLLLDFANSKQVDPRISFTRASTATYFDAQGLMQTAASGDPRIDHDPVTGECKGLLIEESRTNLTVNSQVATSSIGTAVTPNAALAPDGTMSMDFIYEDTTTGEHYAGDRTFTATAGTTYCFSVFIKSTGLPTNMRYYHRIAGSAITSFVFDPNTQFISDVVNTGGYVGHGVIPCGNGVYRAWIAYTAQTSTTTWNRSQLYNASSGGGLYTGDGTSGLYIWGSQLEAGSSPTSYIPTAAAAATRAADVASMTGTNFSEWFNPLEGTFVVGFDAPNIPSDTATYGRVYLAHGGTHANSIDVLINGGWIPDRIGAIINVGGVASFDSTGTANGWAATPVAYAVNATAYKSDSFATSWNGLDAATASAGALPVVNQLNIGCYLSDAQLNGHIRRLAYYPVKFSSSQLQALTA